MESSFTRNLWRRTHETRRAAERRGARRFASPRELERRVKSASSGRYGRYGRQCCAVQRQIRFCVQHVEPDTISRARTYSSRGNDRSTTDGMGPVPTVTRHVTRAADTESAGSDAGSFTNIPVLQAITITQVQPAEHVVDEDI